MSIDPHAQSIQASIQALIQQVAQSTAQNGIDSKVGSKLPANYSGSLHLEYGIPVPVLRATLREWSITHRAALTFAAWHATLDALYRGVSKEERKAAALLLENFPKFRQQLDPVDLEGWIGELSGWEEVDSTCQSIFTAKELLANWSAWQMTLRRLNADPKLEKRRASLVLLLRPVRESTDDSLVDLAFANLAACQHERDKLIAKAVSWLLRDLIKLQAPRVAQFLADHAATMPVSVHTEVRKKLVSRA